MPEGDAKSKANPLGDVGGTPGGAFEFLLGFAMLVAGGYLFLNQVVVVSGYWSLFGVNTFGLTLIPIFIGVVLLFLDGRSIVGWLLSLGGLVAIVAGVLAELQIHFRPTSLWTTLFLLVLMAGGLGLVLRAIRPHRRRE